MRPIALAPSCPVCGQPVDVATAPRSVYQGVTYYLRCAGCKARFDAEPERFLSGAGEAGGCCGAHHGEGHFCVREDGTGQHCGHHELGDPVSGHPHRHMRA